MSSIPYLTCHNLNYASARGPIFDGVSFAVHPGDRIGIVGPNGAGKSTLFKILQGDLKPDSGNTAFRSDLCASFVNQVIPYGSDEVVRTILRAVLPSDDKEALILEQLEKLSQEAEINPDLVSDNNWINKFSRLQDELTDTESTATADNILDTTLNVTGLKPHEYKTIGELSGGLQRRVQIVAALLANPQFILLDEPTNHLDVESVEWLEDILLGLSETGLSYLGLRNKNQSVEPFSFAVISHDRSLLDTLCNRILEIDSGEAKMFRGNFENYVEQTLQLKSERLKQRDKMDNLFRRELAWVKTGAKARTTKQTARIKRFQDLDKSRSDIISQRAVGVETDAFEFQGAMVHSERDAADAMVQKIDVPSQQELIRMEQLCIPSLGVPGLSLFHNFDMVLKPKMRIAMIGPNGCGKSTFLRLLAGEDLQYSGKMIRHELLTLSYQDQLRYHLDSELTVQQTVSPEGDFVSFNNQRSHVKGYLDRFGFRGHDANRPVSELSGGEQARLLLARLMLSSSNLMILDEPTNDLDILTLQSLESSLMQYNGGLVFTSHDRYFVQRVATHIMMWRGVEEKNGIKLTKWSLFADLDQALLTYDEDKKLVKQVADAFVSKDKSVVNRKDTKPTKAKPSQKEQKELQDLEAKIEQLEASSASLTHQLDSAFSQGKSAKETAEISGKLKLLSQQIAASQLRWEELFASH